MHVLLVVLAVLGAALAFGWAFFGGRVIRQIHRGVATGISRHGKDVRVLGNDDD